MAAVLFFRRSTEKPLRRSSPLSRRDKSVRHGNRRLPHAKICPQTERRVRYGQKVQTEHFAQFQLHGTAFGL